MPFWAMMVAVSCKGVSAIADITLGGLTSCTPQPPVHLGETGFKGDAYFDK